MHYYNKNIKINGFLENLTDLIILCITTLSYGENYTGYDEQTPYDSHMHQVISTYKLSLHWLLLIASIIKMTWVDDSL